MSLTIDRMLGMFCAFTLLSHVSFASVANTDLHWSIYNKADGAKRLHFDTAFVENAAGKRLLIYDGKRLENRDRVGILTFDKDTTIGFSIRDPKKPNIRLLWCNGRQLCRTVQGEVVFDYDPRNQTIALTANGPAVYTLTCHNGNSDSRLEDWQIVALAYLLQPQLFTGKTSSP